MSWLEVGQIALAFVGAGAGVYLLRQLGRALGAAAAADQAGQVAPNPRPKVGPPAVEHGSAAASTGAGRAWQELAPAARQHGLVI